MTALATPPKKLHKVRYFHATEYFPHEAQMQIHASRARHRALSNGRRWGKTLLGGKEAEVTAYVMNKLGKPQLGWIVGPQYSDTEKEFRVIYDSLKALGVDKTSVKFQKNVDSGNLHIITGWGWEILGKSAQHPDTLVGEGLDWVLLVEAGRLKRTMFTQYIRPALSDHRGWSLMTGVPEIATDSSLLYWGWSRGQNSEKRTWASWQMPSWTNPIVFPGGRQDEEILEAEDELTADEFERQYGGKFVERVGRVMQEWDDDVHLANLRYNPDWPLYAAVDYGYTNPFVWLWIQIDPFDNIYVLGEHYITYQDTQVIAERTLKNHPLTDKLAAFYPDPAEPDDTAILERILKKPARKNTGGELKLRLQLIRQILKRGLDKVDEFGEWLPGAQPGLLVDRSCTRFAWEMREGYRWPVKKDDADRNDSEIPVDKDNHGPEAFGRFMRGYFDITGDEAGKTTQNTVRVVRGRR